MSRLNQHLFQRILQGEYYTYVPAPVTLGEITLRTAQKMGLPSWPGVDPAARLAAEVVELDPGAQAAVFGCGDGLLPCALSARLLHGQVSAVDPGFLSVEATRLAAGWNGCENLSVTFDDPTRWTAPQALDAVVVNLPKGREMAHAYIIYAQHILRQGGALYLAGANSAGIKGYSDFAGRVFGNLQVRAYKKGCRVVRCTLRGDHPLAEMPDSIQDRVQHFDVNGETLAVATHPGVFAGDKLDGGTKVLLEALHSDPAGAVLDLGCGSGVLGMAAARLAPQGSVTLVDSNANAVRCAGQSIALNGLRNARALASDVTSALGAAQFDLVVSNPPFHTGVEADFAAALAFVCAAAKALKRGGRLLLVANRFIQYEPYLAQVFAEVRTVAENKAYKVIEGISAG